MKIFQVMLLQLLIYITRTSAQSFSCDASLSTSLCPGTIAFCNCNATGTSAQTRWVFTTLNLQCPGGSNFIALAQCAASSGTCGPYLSAANNIGGSCPTSSSTLSITANQSLSGLVVECRDTSSGPPGGTLVGTKNISVVASPGPVGTPLLSSTSVNNLTVAWAPPTTGGVPTSYNVSINDGSNTLVSIPANGPLQNTFTGLTSDTLYTVSVVAKNCAGTSNVTSANRRTLAASPSIQVLSIFNPNNTIRQLQISWTPVGGSVTMYTVRVVGNGASVGPTTTTCTTPPCLYVQQVYVPATNYTILVASINGDGAVGPESSIKGATTSNIGTSVQMLFANNVTISCTFLDGSSHFCLVCCSTTPTAPAGSVGYSTTSGPSVSVSIQNLASNLMYYCTAAATNTKSATCVDPVVGNVKVFFSFMTPAITTPSTTTSFTIGPIVGGVVGGVIFIMIVVIIILIVFIVLKKPKSKTHDDVPLKKRNSSTPATPPSVDRDSPPPPPRPSRDSPPPPPGPNTEAEYSTVDSSKKPQNQGMVYAEVGIRPPASSQQRKPPPMPSSQQVFYGEVRAQ